MKGAILPIFDIKGSFETGNITDVAGVESCYDNNYLLSYEPFIFNDTGFFQQLIPGYIHPTTTGALDTPYNTWGVLSDNTQESLDFSLTYADNIATLSSRDADVNIVYLDGVEVARDGSSSLCRYSVAEYHYKSIASDIAHVSPTQIELESQAESGITPDLPVDKNRYIEFQNTSGNIQKIYYPYLFRVAGSGGLSIDAIDTELQDTLTATSSQLGGLDLLTYLQSKTQTFDILDGINMTYYEALLFALYWNNLNSTAAKYRFIFENYLSDTELLTDPEFELPQSKRQYEIAYI